MRFCGFVGAFVTLSSVSPTRSPPQVPVSEHFVFAQSGSSGSASSGADLIVTSSNSGLAGQEGVDRTAVDIQLFASGAGRSPAALEQPEEGGEEQEELQGGEDSEEGGVSSVVRLIANTCTCTCTCT